MAFMLTSDVSKQYLLEEDAIKGFRMAVENGQSRLALQILTDIVDFFMDVISTAIDDSEELEQATQLEVPSLKKEEALVKEKEIVSEEKDSTSKNSSKKETKPTEEK
jgi:Mg2+ and Co2+ transporter CorA